MTPILPAVDIQGQIHAEVRPLPIAYVQGKKIIHLCFKSSLWLPYREWVRTQSGGRGKFGCYYRPQGRDRAAWAWMAPGPGAGVGVRCGGGGGY